MNACGRGCEHGHPASSRFSTLFYEFFCSHFTACMRSISRFSVARCAEFCGRYFTVLYTKLPPPTLYPPFSLQFLGEHCDDGLKRVNAKLLMCTGMHPKQSSRSTCELARDSRECSPETNPAGFLTYVLLVRTVMNRPWGIEFQ